MSPASTTQSRKQREREARERQILDLSRAIMVRDGYHGLSMDRIAAEIEYSKGTIYNHFACKEEILIALAIETLNKRTELFERASTFRGRPRERMQAIGVAAERFVRQFPEHFQVERILRSSSIWEKTSPKRQAIMRQCEMRCLGIVGGVARDGIAAGDLNLDRFGTSVEELVFLLWSLSFGGYSLIANDERLHELGVASPFHVIRQGFHRLLDGFDWRPRSHELDYDQLAERIQNEVFGDE